MLTFVIWHLEKHLPAIENVIIFIFPAKLLWRFVWENRSEVKFFHFFIDHRVKTSLTIARAIPKFNRITAISFEEFPKFARDFCWINLIRMWWRVENSFSSMDRVHDDDNLIDVEKMGPLVDTTSYCKKLVNMTFTAWWIVLMIGLLWTWMWAINMATWFFILASNITTTTCRSVDTWRVTLSRLYKWFLTLSLLFLFAK